jgi:uncharacterized protein (DUF1499 family)
VGRPDGLGWPGLRHKKIVIVLVLLLVMFFGYRSVKPSGLGVTAGKLAACPASPNCVCSQAGEDEGHRIAPFKYKGSLAEAKAEVKKVVAALPRTELVTETNDYVHFTFTTAIMRYVDDVQFYFDDQRKVIEVRSASRVGHSDLGVNRKRVETIRGLLPAEMRGER